MSLSYGLQMKKCSSVDTQVVDDSWILDSGASRHMTSNRDWYSSWTPLQEPNNVVVGNNARCLAKGTGTVFLKASLSSVVHARSQEESIVHFCTDQQGS